MSTIRCDNFGPSAGGTTYSARGIAKAWVNFNGTGTIAARDSENVSSLTDNGTGNYTVNFSNAFGAGDYAFACSCANGVGGNSIPSSLSTATILTSSFQMIDARPTGAVDRDTFTSIFHGDLA